MNTMAALMEDSGIRFGTSGLRGLVASMTDEVCQAWSMAFLQAVVPHSTQILLGCDLRPSSPNIARACAAALEAAGQEVIFAGPVPTPALAFYALQQGLPAMMITGSHIPFDRNGIKFYRPDGEISKADESAMLAVSISPQVFPSVHRLAVHQGVTEMYLTRYQSFFPAGFLAGKRIGVYEHSSVARDILGKLLSGFGATLISLGRTDDFIPVDTEAVSEADHAMSAAWVTEYELDAIVSTDGDADRPWIADERGQWLRGDIVGLLTAQFLDVKTVITPVSSNTAIERCAFFDSVLRTRIGSPYVIAAMEQMVADYERPVVGFEANGGFILGDAITRDDSVLAPLPTRDAVLPILAVLAMAQIRKLPLSKLAATLPARFTASSRIQNFPTEKSHKLLDYFSASSAAVAEYLGDEFKNPVQCDTTDGLRLTFASDEIIHLRQSGNAPELRCYVEADNDARAKELVQWVLGRIVSKIACQLL